MTKIVVTMAIIIAILAIYEVILAVYEEIQLRKLWNQIIGGSKKKCIGDRYHQEKSNKEVQEEKKDGREEME